MAPGSRGTIDADGTYRGPSQISAKHVKRGCQMLPNNHVFNTRVDGLPVHPKSALWMSVASTGAPNYIGSQSLNIINASTPVRNLTFMYTPKNNGAFRIPELPDVMMQSGWHTPPLGDVDRHLLSLDPSTCSVEEIYDLFPAGKSTGCPTCTSVSGAKYSGNSYALARTGGVDAASMYMAPLSLEYGEVRRALATGGSIQHALRFTLGAPAGWKQGWLWPAFATAYYWDGDRMKMGSRVRLKGSFDITRFSNPATRLLMRQLKEYGIILADAGLQWQISLNTDLWPADVTAAFREVTATLKPSDLEVVDQSSLMVAADSGDTPVDAETVVATSLSNSADKASIRVVLTGVAVGVQYPYETFQAGTGGAQLKYWVNGTPNKSVVWSLTQPVGYISPDGWYTPPSTASASLKTTARVTSVEDPAAYADVDITVVPAGALRIATGRRQVYTDTKGNVWQPGAGVNQGWGYEHSGTYATPDDLLYRSAWENYHDLPYRFRVPNGTYKVTVKMAEHSYNGPGQRVMHIESQGALVRRDLDMFAVSGGMKRPVDVTFDASVTDGVLSIAVRTVKNMPTVSGIEMVSASAPAPLPSVAVSPSAAGDVAAGKTVQFSATSQVTWSLSPALGTISASGLYTAPSSLPAVRTTVTVKATSTVNTSVSATATLVLPAAPAAPAPVPALATASFLRTDLTTQGSWRSVYGADGYVIPGTTAKNPSYASVTQSGAAFWAWSMSTQDVRALQKPSPATDRIASLWSTESSYKIDVNVTDGAKHQMALYLLDFDNYAGGRYQRIDILDVNNTLLDSRTVSGFSKGQYLVWNVTGRIVVRITNLSSTSNAGISGIFFGTGSVAPPPAVTVPGAASFVKVDTTTRGSWRGVYGSGGYNIAVGAVLNPAYASVTPPVSGTWVWSSSTQDTRGLQKPSPATDRLAACWSTESSLKIDVNITDGARHQLAVYLIDWDNWLGGRYQRIDILDANNNVLDSRIVTGFVNGQYLVWNVTGRLTVRVTNLSPTSNATISGLFLD